MAVDMQAVEAGIKSILDLLRAGFWTHLDFWISTGVGALGILLSAAAFWQAKKAREAATEAGKTVHVQTIAIDLTEVSQSLGALDQGITYFEARNVLNLVFGKLHRLTASIEREPEFGVKVQSLRKALDAGHAALDDVRPTDPSQPDPSHSIYYAIESHLRKVNGEVGDLIGLIQRRTVKFGKPDDGRQS